MRKNTLIRAIFGLGLAVFTLIGSGNIATAAVGSNFQPGRIIDDQVFYDKNSMSVADIQNFLIDMLDGTPYNGANLNCDTTGSKVFTGYYDGRDSLGVNHSPKTSPHTYTLAEGVLRSQLDNRYPAPYICLKDYFEDPVSHENNLTKADGTASPKPPQGISAAQIIYNSAQNYGINPKVLLVMIQKESLGGLMTDSWPWYTQYKYPMGYACNDTSPCDPQYIGFYNQVWSAARQYRLYANNPNGYSYTIGLNNILYHPTNPCGTQAVIIQNQATASLYDYTPYVPNAAALNNMYGTGDSCSSYGNRNFWRMYTDWFGTTFYNGNDPVGSLDLAQPAPGGVRVAGWGLDRSMSGPADIHVYIDNTFAGVIAANISRADVGIHGFDGIVPWTTAGTHNVCTWVVGDAIGAANYGTNCQSITTNSDTVGSLDLVQSTPGGARLAGWAVDRSMAGPASIHVYVDGKWGGLITTGATRNDLGGVYANMGSNRGFDGNVAISTNGNHQVCTWAVGDAIGAQIYGMGCRTINTNNDPLGSLDLVQAAPGSIRVAGWGLDRSTVDPASIHIYIDGSFAAAIMANLSRPDVGAAFPGIGDNHGYDTNINWPTPGTHQVCAWVVGDALGAPNYGMGCRTVKN